MSYQLRAGRILTARGGHGADIRLHDFRNTPAVWWSADKTSYVIMAGLQTPLVLASINGIGEIRWTLDPAHPLGDSRAAEAIAYFLEAAPETPCRCEDARCGDGCGRVSVAGHPTAYGVFRLCAACLEAGHMGPANPTPGGEADARGRVVGGRRGEQGRAVLAGVLVLGALAVFGVGGLVGGVLALRVCAAPAPIEAPARPAGLSVVCENTDWIEVPDVYPARTTVCHTYDGHAYGEPVTVTIID